MHVRSFCLLRFALPSLAALALPPAVHAASAVHGRPRRSPGRGPPYWKSRVLRRKVLGEEDEGGRRGSGAHEVT
jgi:hypothetical protein